MYAYPVYVLWRLLTYTLRHRTNKSEPIFLCLFWFLYSWRLLHILVMRIILVLFWHMLCFLISQPVMFFVHRHGTIMWKVKRKKRTNPKISVFLCQLPVLYWKRGTSNLNITSCTGMIANKATFSTSHNSYMSPYGL